MEQQNEMKIRSNFILFGVIRCTTFDSTVLAANAVTICIRSPEAQQARISFRITVKHIIQVLLVGSASQNGILLRVSPYCARSIRYNLGIRKQCCKMNFDPDHEEDIFRYLIIDVCDTTPAIAKNIEYLIRLVYKARCEATGSGLIRDYFLNFFGNLSDLQYANLLSRIESANSTECVTEDLFEIADNAQNTTQNEPIKRVAPDRVELNCSHSNMSNMTSTETDTASSHISPNESAVTLRYKRVLASNSGMLPLEDAVVAKKKTEKDIRYKNENVLDAYSANELDIRSRSDLVERRGNQVLVTYPQGESGAVSLLYADMLLLRPSAMLNDTIIDFFLKYIHLVLVREERRSKIFVFNSFFYERLTRIANSIENIFESDAARARRVANNYKSVRNWTKDVDIFGMDYVVIPINENYHWYLAIICHPGSVITNEMECKVESSEIAVMARASGKTNIFFKKPQIIIFDSFTGFSQGEASGRQTASILRAYLECEFNDKKEKSNSTLQLFSKEAIPRIALRALPQQANHTDCGVFLLKYVSLFLQFPPEHIMQTDSFKRWYPYFSVHNMRAFIVMCIRSVCADDNWQAFIKYSRVIYDFNTLLRSYKCSGSARDMYDVPLLRRTLTPKRGLKRSASIIRSYSAPCGQNRRKVMVVSRSRTPTLLSTELTYGTAFA